MQYINKQFTDFFSDLENNNNRQWFAENKSRYEESVKIPFENLIDQIIVLVRDEDSNFCADTKKAIFRIHKDIRFSKDKTPYKTFASAAISYGGKKELESPGFYIEISHKYFTYYGGIYMMSKERLLKFRKFLFTFKEEFEKLKNEEDFVELFTGIIGERNKKLSHDLEIEAKKYPILYNKQFYFTAKYPVEKIFNNNLPEFVFKHYLAGRNVSDFIYEGMGLIS
jgi:uncharacterized protein (TIGR02453 family)